MPVLSAALSDIGDTDSPLPGLERIESSSRARVASVLVNTLRSVHSHKQIYGDHWSIQEFIDAPARDVFNWLADPRSLEEWTISLRGFRPADEPGLWSADDLIADDVHPCIRSIANSHAMTVDYHCAWDQGRDLWIVYLMRVVNAQMVLGRPGSVVVCNSWRHPFHDHNPYPHTTPAGRSVWVGDLWPIASAAHRVELRNLKVIAEYRHRRGLPLTPEWMA